MLSNTNVIQLGTSATIPMDEAFVTKEAAWKQLEGNQNDEKIRSQQLLLGCQQRKKNPVSR